MRTPQTGLLADGSAITNVAGQAMCIGGYYPLYAIATNGTEEAIYGWLQFSNINNSYQLTANSAVVWLASKSVNTNYAGGFTNNSSVIGSAFPSGGLATRPFTFAWAVLGDLLLTNASATPMPLANLVEFTNNAPTFALTTVDGSPDSLGASAPILTIDQNGLISAGFKNPASTNTATINTVYGLYVPSANQGAGFFLDGG